MLEVYLVAFWVGLILTLVLTIFGGTGHSGHFFLHLNFGSHQVQGGGHAGPGPLNLTSLLGFLTGFGGCGFVMTRFGFAGGVFVLGTAILVGLGIGWFLFFMLVQVFARGERVMHESDYELRGMLGYVSVRIPSGGVGEVKYVLAGTTRSIGARADGAVGEGSIEKHTEVVIVNVEKGLATVVQYDEYVHGESE